MMSRHDVVLDELGHHVRQLATDPVLRRALRYEPASVVGSWGRSLPEPSGPMPVRHLEVPSAVDPDVVLPPPAAATATHAALPPSARLVAYGVRPAALLHGPTTFLAEWADAARAQGLYTLLSPWTAEPVPDDARGGFSDLSGPPRPAGADDPWGRSLLVTASRERMVAGWLSLLYGWDTYLGLVLGYPRCCAEAFPASWTRAQEHAGDVGQVLLSDVRPGRVRFPWQCNLFARVHGAVLPVHLPCSLTCPSTVALVDEHVAQLQLIEPGLAHDTTARLRAPLVVTPDRHVTAAPHPISPTPDAWLLEPGEPDEIPVLTAV